MLNRERRPRSSVKIYMIHAHRHGGEHIKEEVERLMMSKMNC